MWEIVLCVAEIYNYILRSKFYTSAKIILEP
jgi:hypothetical protein